MVKRTDISSLTKDSALSQSAGTESGNANIAEGSLDDGPAPFEGAPMIQETKESPIRSMMGTRVDDHGDSNTDSGWLEQIKIALEKLEAYSLSSSEDINDCIEQLVTCLNSNTSAL